MNRFVIWFTKITGAPICWFYFKKKIYYQNKKKQSRRIKGPAIIVSNHTSVYDYALYLYVFFGRCIRTLMAELLYEKNKFLKWFLKRMGGIRVDRNNYDFDFMGEAIKCLDKRQVVLIFPESRIPQEGEATPLEFKPSFIYVALESGAPIIPVYTNGEYNKKGKRARVVIGEAIDLREVLGEAEPTKENIEMLANMVRERVIKLGETLNEEKTA